MINDIFIGSLQKQNRSENKGGGIFILGKIDILLTGMVLI